MLEILPTHKCPKCRHEATYDGVKFTIGDKDLDGVYCVKCFAVLIKKNCGKLEPLTIN